MVPIGIRIPWPCFMGTTKRQARRALAAQRIDKDCRDRLPFSWEGMRARGDETKSSLGGQAEREGLHPLVRLSRTAPAADGAAAAPLTHCAAVFEHREVYKALENILWRNLATKSTAAEAGAIRRNEPRLRRLDKAKSRGGIEQRRGKAFAAKKTHDGLTKIVHGLINIEPKRRSEGCVVFSTVILAHGVVVKSRNLLSLHVLRLHPDGSLVLEIDSSRSIR